MTCPPRSADRHRTVLETTTIDNSDGWWTGIVQDRNHETDETRLRLERWVENGRSYTNPHKWRVRPDFWDEERDAVMTFRQHGGRSPPENLPIDDHLTVLESRRVRKDDVRWVAVVRVEKPSGAKRVRLYHWDPVDGSNRQKWTIGRRWSQVEETATRQLQPVA